jgi:hypothetical protein
LGRAGEEVLLELGVEKVLRALIAQIEPVMVDQLLLQLQPFRPTDVADLVDQPMAQIVRERAVGNRLAGLRAASRSATRSGSFTSQSFRLNTTWPPLRIAKAESICLE